METAVIKNHYSSNRGTNNIIVYQVFRGYALLKTFRGKTAERRAYKYKLSLEV